MDYQRLALRRADFTGRVNALWQDVDLLLIPAMPFAAPTHAMMATLGEDAALLAGALRYTCPFDSSGSPTLTLPGGVNPEGIPVAIQFVAPNFEESLLVRAGWAFQRATHWHRQHPR